MEKFSGITTIYLPGAPWLIFLHGFPDDSSVWSLQVEELKNHFNVWCPDLYSHSYSDQIKGVSDYIRNIKADEKIYLVGHDMGGPVACEVSEKLVGRVSKVLLINTLSFEQFLSRWKNPGQLIKSFYMPLFIGPLHNTKLWKIFASKFLKFAYDKGDIDPQDPIRHHTPLSIDGIKRYREAFLQIPKTLAKENKKLNTETHFLSGSQDPFVNVPDEQELRKHFQSHSLEVIPTNHWPQRTHAKDVTQWIQRKISNG